ncbi:hypothetical protein HanIR_Chr14g0701491 [Helianthus annuus]|nr:hypothetical protein HanIR_Chr14g0701491 [Helianthus annuus]
MNKITSAYGGSDGGRLSSSPAIEGGNGVSAERMSATKKHGEKVCAWVRPFGDDLCEEFQGFMKNDRRLRFVW